MMSNACFIEFIIGETIYVFAFIKKVLFSSVIGCIGYNPCLPSSGLEPFLR